MGRNIVVCCDGTANQVVAGNDTNVVRLCAVTVKDPSRQIVYYGPGLGTMEAEGALTWFGRVLTRLAGLAFGYGIARDIRNAYAFIMATYQPGDRLYLFGFSRGAYTARAVASLLKTYGLLRIGNESLVPYVVRELLHFNPPFAFIVQMLAPNRLKNRIDKKFAKARQIRETFATLTCKPDFVGVWDTVSSVGWIFSPTRIPYTAKNSDIAVGRHALALHERRAFYIRNLWQFDPRETPQGPLNIKEVWFSGVHCDAGGGYPEAESGLAKLTFGWMLREAEAHGLVVDDAARRREMGETGQGRARPDANAKMHNSMTWLWGLVEFVPIVSGLRGKIRINLFRRRYVPAGALIHASVFDRRDNKRPLPAEHRTEH